MRIAKCFLAFFAFLHVNIRVTAKAHVKLFHNNNNHLLPSYFNLLTSYNERQCTSCELKPFRWTYNHLTISTWYFIKWCPQNCEFVVQQWNARLQRSVKLQDCSEMKEDERKKNELIVWRWKREEKLSIDLVFLVCFNLERDVVVMQSGRLHRWWCIEGWKLKRF